MKFLAFSLVVLCTLILGSVSWESKAANETGRQSAVAQFNRPVVLHGLTLKSGKYLFVHDDAAMKRGEDCTYVYEGTAPFRQKLMVSFHCIHVERAKAARFVVRSEETGGLLEVREFQFAGDTASHAVPSNIEVHVVPTSVTTP